MQRYFNLRLVSRLALAAAILTFTLLIGTQPAFPQPTPTGPIRLVKDINPTNYNLANPVIIGEIGDELLFVQEVDPYGRELWASDGTAEGTRLLADINPGIIDSEIEVRVSTPRRAVAVVGTHVVLAGYNAFYERELYIYNMENNDLSVVDIVPNGSSSPAEFATYNGKVYFSASGDGVNNSELWSVDVGTGTAAQVADINPGPSASTLGDLTATPFGLFFAAKTQASGYELWVTDGTEAGTRQVKEIYPGDTGSDPQELTLLNDRLLFIATDENDHTDLWSTDGTSANTMKVSPPDGSTTGMAPSELHIFNGNLYFNAYDSNENQVLWMSDGTNSGTMPIVPLSPYLLASNATNLFFIADDPTNNDATSIWKSDGTAENSTLVTALPENAAPRGSTMLGNQYVVNLNVANVGSELWVSDGTAEGTKLLKDTHPDGDDQVKDLYVLGDTLYFTANDGVHGSELWKSDGTAEGTVRVQPVERNAVSYVFRSTKVGDNIFMFAEDGVHGFELWKSDGTSDGTMLVKDINPGQTGSILFSPASNTMADVNGTLYFAASDGQNGRELWKSDGTAEGTMMAVNIVAGSSGSAPRYLTAFKDHLMFWADVKGDREPWISDGTAAGTFMLKDINPGGSSNPSNFTVVGEQLVFVADDGAHGPELWRSDGTITNTLLIGDMYGGSTGSNPRNFTVHEDKLFFSADNGENGHEVWQYDSQTNTATMLLDLYPGATGSLPSRFIAMRDGLVFKANTPDKGVELVRLSDGVATVFDINPNGNSNPSWLTLIGEELYFTADDGNHGFELWKLTPGGSPLLVRDIKPGKAGSYPEYMEAAADERTVVFKADDGVHGMELWRSDGRSTAMVQDLEPGSGSSSPVDIKLLGEQLYFVAAPSSSGMEFFVLDGVDLQPRIYLPLQSSN